MHDRAGEGFSDEKKIKKQQDFRRVYQQGAKYRGHYFTFYLLSRETAARLGIAVSRGWGNAVERNQIKRFLREAFRHHYALFGNMEVIVRPNSAIKGLPYHQVRQWLIEEYRVAIRTEVSYE